MSSYIPNTKDEQAQMLSAIGFSSFEEMLAFLPNDVVLQRPLNIGDGLTEQKTYELLKKTASKNKVYDVILRGAGAYNHYIPSVVPHLASREEFVTAYTPYQAEISQGLLQAIFEYQTMICELCGMDASNASVYDGATAGAEAMLMCADKKRSKILISSLANPENIAVMKTYAHSYNLEIELIPSIDGVTDIDALNALADEKTAGVYFSQPNYLGNLEEGEKICEIAHQKGAKAIMNIYPIAAAVLKSCGEVGADIAVGEGQPLGMPLSFGGPYLGFMAVKAKDVRKLPGRIVGQTVDVDGKRAYVLTLQAREQHIKRERATSSICSNQALCALTASIYLSSVGKNGFKTVAQNCYRNAHYFAQQLTNLKTFKLKYNKTFFNEFVTHSSISPQKIEETLSKRGILSGLTLDESSILWCATEINDKQSIDEVVAILMDLEGADV